MSAFHRGQGCFPQFFGSESSPGSSNGLFSLCALHYFLTANTKGPCYRESHRKVLNKVTYICSGSDQNTELHYVSLWFQSENKKGMKGRNTNAEKIKTSRFCLIVHLHLAALSQTPVHEISPAENQWPSKACKGQPFSRLALVDQSSTGLYSEAQLSRINGGDRLCCTQLKLN